jgi:UDP-glucuronate 4-epimerase
LNLGDPKVTIQAERIVLTGGAGFIGSHLAEAILRRGSQLTIIDNLDSFYSPKWKEDNLQAIRKTGNFDFEAIDICDRESLNKVFERVQPHIVIHLAGRAGVRPSIDQPELYQQVNVAGTVNLLELCRKNKVRKFVFGSSSSVYGESKHAPFSEDLLELRPISPYAATKLSGEMLCYTYAHLYQLPSVCLRFFTVYGPRQRPDLAIHKFTALIEAGKPIPIFGDGGSGRDFTFVNDIVAGVLASVDYTMPSSSNGNGNGNGHAKAVPFEIFNLGNSHPVKLRDLVSLIEEATGKKALRETHPFQAGDVPLTWADVSKANRLLGYKPATELKEGLAQFVRWYRAADPGRRL